MWNGSRSVLTRPIMIIRATQKKRMSYPVSMTKESWPIVAWSWSGQG